MLVGFPEMLAQVANIVVGINDRLDQMDRHVHQNPQQPPANPFQPPPIPHPQPLQPPHRPHQPPYTAPILLPANNHVSLLKTLKRMARTSSNPPRPRKIWEPETAATTFKRARDGSAFTRCEECNKDVPVVLIDMHCCSLDSRIWMHLESQVVETETKKPAEKKKTVSTEKKVKNAKSKDPNAPKRPPVFSFSFETMVAANAVKVVSPHKFVKAYAARLKRSGKIELPHWNDIVKTSKFKELAPYDPDWYRAASLSRKLYLRHGIGVGAFQKIYGGRQRNGSRPPHFCKSSGSIARHILQRLQEMNIIDPKGERRNGDVERGRERRSDFK